MNLDKNRLHTLHSSSLKNCTGLQSLSLSHNFLTQVPEAVHHLSNLEILDLSSNLLGVLKRESLQGLPKLKSLKLGKYLYIYLSISIFPTFYGKQVYILYWLEELNCRFFFLFVSLVENNYINLLLGIIHKSRSHFFEFFAPLS